MTSPCCPPSAHGPLEAPPASERLGSYENIYSDAGKDSEFECYVVLPPQGTKQRGTVIICHDVAGPRGGRHEQVCDKLATMGFAAVCPDLFGDSKERHEANILPTFPQFTPRNLINTLFGLKLGYILKMKKMVVKTALPKIVTTLAYLKEKTNSEVKPCVAIGFCWGALVVGEMLADTAVAEFPYDIKCGIGFHPAYGLMSPSEAEKMIQELARPLLLAPAGDDKESQLGTPLAEMLMERKLSDYTDCVVPFSDMHHGWMTRGPLNDENVARDYAAGMKLALDFIDAHM